MYTIFVNQNIYFTVFLSKSFFVSDGFILDAYQIYQLRILPTTVAYPRCEKSRFFFYALVFSYTIFSWYDLYNVCTFSEFVYSVQPGPPGSGPPNRLFFSDLFLKVSDLHIWQYIIRWCFLCSLCTPYLINNLTAINIGSWFYLEPAQTYRMIRFGDFLLPRHRLIAGRRKKNEQIANVPVNRDSWQPWLWVGSWLSRQYCD